MNGIFWFRRDLRLEDHKILYKALRECEKVSLLFIFDKEILDQLPRDDHRVSFLFQRLSLLQSELQVTGKQLQLLYGNPFEVFEELVEKNSIDIVYTSADYEPYARKRDGKVADLLASKNISFIRLKEGVVFEQNEIVKDDGSPYVVFTPYKKKWMAALRPESDLASFPSEHHLNNVSSSTLNSNYTVAELSDFGFKKSSLTAPTSRLTPSLIDQYEATRNFPGIPGTSQLGVYLRFGTISIRKLVREALDSTNHTFLSELIWREFFQQILWHFPHTVTRSFKPAYDAIPWRNTPEDLEKWKQGKTGYALVDAGMRELNATGYMHNRVRMLTASFLCKHLLIDWRLGEAYFAEKLFDFELASNIGNWQWAAGSGVDAAPYFRIFNPETQISKFDRDLSYIRKWVPEFESLSYQPIVDHKFARERCLTTYKSALQS